MLTLLKSKHKLVQDVLRDAVAALQREKIETASLDARILLQHVLHASREALLIAMSEPMEPAMQQRFLELIERRAKRVPVSHLIGKREFWGMEFRVTADTLDPRPDSETVIEAVLERCRDREKSYKILDLGSGTGCLSLALLKELPRATAIGVDISDGALAVAKENALLLGFQGRSQYLVSRWCEKVVGAYDIVVANPPYIPTKSIDALAPEVAQYEPKVALDGGTDGLQCYREMVPALPKVLNDSGFAVLEMGAGQHDDLARIAGDNALRVDASVRDLSGTVRCMVLTREIKQHKE
jgi:release factor glutamine methyltransferase